MSDLNLICQLGPLHTIIAKELLITFVQITPREALKAELRFAVNIWATKKPVKIGKSNSGSLEDGFTRAASTARSIVGSFLRLDILDKLDKDHDTNNRSNDRKIN